MGDGTWKFNEYWTVNHSLSPGNEQTKPTVNGAPASNANLPSRYDVYRYEIAQGANPTNPFINNPSGRNLSSPPSNGEIGRPMCSGSTPADPLYTPDAPDRRLFFAAIVNCKANLPPSLPLSGGNNTGVPVAAFGKFFITEPVKAAQDEIRAEIVELVTPGNSAGYNYDQVQLYR